MKRILVCGAGGFIGAQMVKRLKNEGCWVRGVDLKYPPYFPTQADDFIIGDLRDPYVSSNSIDQKFDEIYQFAADMGGAGFVFTGENDYEIMHNSALININIIESMVRRNNNHVFYSSSACMYPEYNQLDPDNLNLSEDSAYPAAPDSEYGWEKLFSERLYLTAARTKNLKVRVARYHNIFGEEGSWNNGREKAPAAICRKVAMAQSTDQIEVWGDGNQTRSFLHVDECIEATLRFSRSNWTGPVNIGSDEMVSINQLVMMVSNIANKDISIKNIPGPVGVRGRNSDNALYEKMMGWRVSEPLVKGLERTYNWIKGQVAVSQYDNDA